MFFMAIKILAVGAAYGTVAEVEVVVRSLLPDVNKRNTFWAVAKEKKSINKELASAASDYRTGCCTNRDILRGMALRQPTLVAEGSLADRRAESSNNEAIAMFIIQVI
ncbi:hypothetical protein HK100_008680 [Physocladia obscura]|uniref:Uncharacterized protein n=1 Tax=Physocladia obscura TaxID=109957 RepID=A0AAD5SNX9_9FUNG|nr:hypothetical protein HK100_008680 [Physocladia obscura]